MIRTRNTILFFRTSQAHRDAFFTTVKVGKGAVCQDRAYFGLDGESAGGNGTRGNPIIWVSSFWGSECWLAEFLELGAWG